MDTMHDNSDAPVTVAESDPIMRVDEEWANRSVPTVPRALRSAGYALERVWLARLKEQRLRPVDSLEHGPYLVMALGGSLVLFMASAVRILLHLLHR
jgi:hypothetical protein